MFEEKNIVLASGSPRRKQILEQAEVEFTMKTKVVAEDYPDNLKAEEVPEFLARKKAAFCINHLKNELIITADTVVILENKIMDKPADKQMAVETLKSLSGKVHKVITGVCLMNGIKQESFSVTTLVRFKKLSEETIHHYVEKYCPLDKAGAYGIQEWIGLVGIERIDGDYFNVVGLPISRLIEEIAHF